MRVLVLGVLAALACQPMAGANAREMPAAIAAAVKQIGPVIDPATAKLFEPLQQKEPYRDVKIVRDETYGSDVRQRLDVFSPQAAGPPRPVLIFVHGGGFTEGDKHRPGSPFYDNIMLWAVANGMVGINMTYRLAPQHQWPAGAQDVAAAVAWTKANVSRFGGDPARVYLMGHSAGAIHAASYLSHPAFYEVPGGGLAGAILVSGLYEFNAAANGPPIRAYFGDDLSKWPERSSQKGLTATKLPLLVMRAELDPPAFVAQNEALNKALCASAVCPTYVVLQGHSHISEVDTINTQDTSVTDPIRSFVHHAR